MPWRLITCLVLGHLGVQHGTSRQHDRAEEISQPPRGRPAGGLVVPDTRATTDWPDTRLSPVSDRPSGLVPLSPPPGVTRYRRTPWQGQPTNRANQTGSMERSLPIAAAAAAAAAEPTGRGFDAMPDGGPHGSRNRLPTNTAFEVGRFCQLPNMAPTLSNTSSADPIVPGTFRLRIRYPDRSQIVDRCTSSRRPPVIYPSAVPDRVAAACPCMMSATRVSAVAHDSGLQADHLSLQHSERTQQLPMGSALRPPAIVNTFLPLAIYKHLSTWWVFPSVGMQLLAHAATAGPAGHNALGTFVPTFTLHAQLPLIISN